MFDNDGGITVQSSTDCCMVSENLVVNNRVYGIALADGRFTTLENQISAGNVGIVVVAASVDAVAFLREDAITGTTVAPVQELSCCGFTATAIVQAD